MNNLDKTDNTSEPIFVAIPTQKVLFDLSLQRSQIAAFRGAIVFKAGLEKETLHNHKNIQNEKRYLHHRYPMVQYQIHGRKAAIVAFGAGAAEVQAFLKTYDGQLILHRKRVKAPILGDISTPSLVAVAPKTQRYELTHWIALNPTSYLRWQKADGLVEQLQVLEKQLENHIVALCKGIQWRPSERFSVRILNMEQLHVTHRKQRYLAFNVTYKTNLILPQYFGLGKASSEGFGKNVRLSV